jgi:hypothetical protein
VPDQYFFDLVAKDFLEELAESFKGGLLFLSLLLSSSD